MTISGAEPNVVILSDYGSYGQAIFTFYFDDTHTNTGWKWEYNGDVSTGGPNDLNFGNMNPIICE
ncbi:hypothetical protein [Candidatus Scalindua japonica]|uniref:hypothetical protein n=1 Tax=Candidatus Scalindua japonica TaxID=1284222 RepID=UPI000BDF3C2A|nr:hypothetical protein [Candidatus Scalindua japonica]